MLEGKNRSHKPETETLCCYKSPKPHEIAHVFYGKTDISNRLKDLKYVLKHSNEDSIDHKGLWTVRVKVRKKEQNSVLDRTRLLLS